MLGSMGQWHELIVLHFLNYLLGRIYPPLFRKSLFKFFIIGKIIFLLLYGVKNINLKIMELLFVADLVCTH